MTSANRDPLDFRGKAVLITGAATGIGRAVAVGFATRDAQLAAITAWGIPDESKLNRLAGITQPTLVANGDNDTMMHTQNSHLLAEHLPNAQLRIYPDAGHGFLDQYPEQFADDVHAFTTPKE